MNEKSRPKAAPSTLARSDHRVALSDDKKVENTSTAFYGSSTVNKRARSNTAQLEILDQAIIAAAAAENPVSLRGVFYRVVSAGAIEKTENGYRRVGRQLTKLRASGAIPYHWITDGTRLMRKPESWSDLDRMLDAAASSYRRALWADQSDEVIILSEKDAISGSIWPVTARWDVELGITRGYSSVTFTYSIAQTVVANSARGKTTWIYQLGDHDPSGVDGWRSFQESVRRFAPDGWFEFDRLAVTPAQIVEFNLPTRPTKTTDSRAAGFAGESVEVDAIAPSVLREIVEDAIVQHIDSRQLDLTQMVEDSERRVLTAMIGGAR